MSVTVAPPTSSTVHDLLTALLLGKPVSVSTAPARTPKDTDVIAEYRRSDGTLGAVWLVDRPNAIRVSAALVNLSRAQTEEAVRDCRLGGILDENFREIANVLGSLVNGPESDHLVFTGYTLAGHASPEARALLEQARDGLRAVGYTIRLAGGGDGNMTIALDA